MFHFSMMTKGAIGTVPVGAWTGSWTWTWTWTWSGAWSGRETPRTYETGRKFRFRREREACPNYAPLSHFFTKLAFAAPKSGLPSLLTAESSQHFFIELDLAAPLRAFPSLLTAFVAQDCAKADPAAKQVIRSASARRFMVDPAGSVEHNPTMPMAHRSAKV